MDFRINTFRVSSFGIVLVVIGLYVQSFYYDFMLRVIGVIAIIIGGLMLSFILGAYLGKGKERYVKLYRGEFNV